MTRSLRALAACALLVLPGCGLLVHVVRDAVEGGGGGELVEGSHAHGSTNGGSVAFSIGCGAASSSPQRVYTFVVPRDDTYVFDSRTSDYDGVLAVYEDGGGELGCNDDHDGTRSSQVTLSLRAGQHVRVVQGGYSGRAGHYELWVHGMAPSASAAPRPPPQALRESTPTSGDTSGLAGIPGLDCPPAGPMQEWSFAPSADATYLIQVDAAYDAYLALFAAQDTISIACNDDSGGSVQRSRVVAPLVAGTTYRVVVGGYSGQSGSYVVSAAPLPTSTVLSLDRPLWFEASGSDGEPNLCGAPQGSIDRAFTFTPPSEAFYSVYADTAGWLVVHDGRRVIACVALDGARRGGLLLKGGRRYRFTFELGSPDGGVHAMLVQRVQPEDTAWDLPPSVLPTAAP